MHYNGDCILPDGHPDNYGEVIKFVHVRFPEWHVVVESRVPYRDSVGNARGIQNLDSALRITFRGRMFETNNRRIIEALREHPEYKGKRGPLWINEAIGNRKLSGCIEVDKREEELVRKKAEFEARIRSEMAREAQAMKAPRPEPVADAGGPSCPNCGQLIQGKFCSECGTPRPRPVTEVPAEKLCDNCGSTGPGNFCPECGTAFPKEFAVSEEDKKRTWACKYCGEEFPSGFELGDHKKTCEAKAFMEEQLREATQIESGGPQMIHGPHSTTNLGIRSPAFDGEGLL